MEGVRAKDDEGSLVIAGRSAHVWVDMFLHTHPISNDFMRVEWPFGGSYMEQPNKLIQIFDVIKNEAVERINEKRKKAK